MTEVKQQPNLRDVIAEEDDRSIAVGDKMAMLLVACVAGLIANWAATGVTPLTALPGMAFLFAASALGLLMAHFVPWKMPAVAWVSLIAILMTIPGMPGSARVVAAVGELNFLALATPALAYGGLALTRTEFDIARASGWKIVIVAICTMFGTYIGSVVIAELTLRLFG
jgi:hypothetical protein